jgi:hypothetical protein
VTLDGQQIKGLLDTGANGTALRKDIAEQRFGLVMGDAGTPVNGDLNGDVSLKTYSHLFKSLSFGDVTVANPRLTIIPNAAGRNADRTPLVADRAKTERDLINGPELTIGMDVLRRLRLYSRKARCMSRPHPHRPRARGPSLIRKNSWPGCWRGWTRWSRPVRTMRRT